MIARALIEDGAEGEFELAAADVQCEAEVRHLHEIGEMIEHPCFGAACEAGAQSRHSP